MVQKHHFAAGCRDSKGEISHIHLAEDPAWKVLRQFLHSLWSRQEKRIKKAEQVTREDAANEIGADSAGAAVWSELSHWKKNKEQRWRLFPAEKDVFPLNLSASAESFFLLIMHLINFCLPQGSALAVTSQTLELLLLPDLYAFSVTESLGVFTSVVWFIRKKKKKNPFFRCFASTVYSGWKSIY